MTLLLAVETMFVGVQANTVIVMYVDNRNYPGGPWQWFLATQYLAINVIFFATLFVLTFLCDLIVVCLSMQCRCTTYSHFIPALALLGHLDCIWEMGRIYSCRLPDHGPLNFLWYDSSYCLFRCR